MTRRRILADILVAGLLVGIAHCKPAPEKTKAIPPPPQGTSQPVPPQQPRAGPATLENTYWKLTHLGDRPVLVTLDQPEPYLHPRFGDWARERLGWLQPVRRYL